MSSKVVSARKKIAGAVLVLAVGLMAFFGFGGVNAAWTASDTGELEVSTGNMSVTLSGVGASADKNLSFTNLMPGDFREDRVVVKNTGTVPAGVKFGMTAAFTKGDPGAIAATERDMLTVQLDQINNGQSQSVLAFVNGLDYNLGTLAPGDSMTLVFKVAFSENAGNSWQGVGAKGTYKVTLSS